MAYDPLGQKELQGYPNSWKGRKAILAVITIEWLMRNLEALSVISTGMRRGPCSGLWAGLWV